MGILQRVRRVRGTWLDPFRNTPERRLARELLVKYEDDMALVLAHASERCIDQVVELASLPEKIRGYGHVREAHAKRLERQRSALRATVTHQPERMEA